MIVLREFPYEPNDHESEKASNAYLMSLIALIAGMPFPIINLIATFIFFLGNLKATKFVRWHCTQALLSQVTVLMMNSGAVYWTLSIIFDANIITNQYIAYIITVVVFNISEFIVTIYTAVNSRKGIHVEWWFFGALTNSFFNMDEIADQTPEMNNPFHPNQNIQSIND